jgi:phosphoribosylformylglycinamidine synthase PurS subunit
MSAPSANQSTRKASVYVSLKKTVLDPQGATIQSALHSLGHGSVQAVRQGKYFAIELDGSLSPEKAREEVERIAKEVLTNPVIEEYQISMS